MQLNITARHLKLTPALSDYVQKKLQKADRYFDHLIWGQVILDVQKERHIAEIIIHASGKTVTAKEQSTDLYAAVDLASDNIDRQVRRFKDRLKLHRDGHGRPSPKRLLAAAGADALDDLPQREHPVSHMRTLKLIPLTLKEAIHSMEQSDSAHWIFMNKNNKRVTVVYRKPDKTYGVVEAIA